MLKAIRLTGVFLVVVGAGTVFTCIGLEMGDGATAPSMLASLAGLTLVSGVVLFVTGRLFE